MGSEELKKESNKQKISLHVHLPFPKKCNAVRVSSENKRLILPVASRVLCCDQDGFVPSVPPARDLIGRR